MPQPQRGWLTDDEQDFGQGDDALQKYVASFTPLPQRTPPGTQFSYNNVAVDVANFVCDSVRPAGARAIWMPCCARLYLQL